MVQKLWGFKDFRWGLGMPSATANATNSDQNCLKLSKTTKICPETINSGNFEIPPKIEIFVSPPIAIFAHRFPLWHEHDECY